MVLDSSGLDGVVLVLGVLSSSDQTGALELSRFMLALLMGFFPSTGGETSDVTDLGLTLVSGGCINVEVAGVVSAAHNVVRKLFLFELAGLQVNQVGKEHIAALAVLLEVPVPHLGEFVDAGLLLRL